jgi:pimeloyl-ACP methyl ester carboxylesterase
MILKAIIALCLLIFVFICGDLIIKLTGGFDISSAALEAKYKLPDSKFIELDGIRVHYVDQGPPNAAEVVVLLHASLMNLRTWDSLAAALTPRYRVIRLDFPSLGLTGPDPKERYSIELDMEMVDQLTKALGVEKFALVGTSSGAVAGFRYAALHPEKVTRLVLINSAGMPRIPSNDPSRARDSALMQWFRSHYKSKEYFQEESKRVFPSKPAPPWFAEMQYDMNRRVGRNRESKIFLANYRTGDPEGVLAKVRAPTLILWGMENVAVMHLEANVFELWLTGAPSLIKKYPKLGHYPYLEEPQLVDDDVSMFLSGAMDGELLQTKRLPPGTECRFLGENR